MMSPTVKLPFASHVEPATPDRVKTATLPSTWLVRRNGRWPPPELSINILLAESVLPAPAPASFGLANSFLPGDAVDLPRMRTYAVSRDHVTADNVAQKYGYWLQAAVARFRDKQQSQQSGLAAQKSGTCSSSDRRVLSAQSLPC